MTINNPLKSPKSFFESNDFTVNIYYLFFLLFFLDRLLKYFAIEQGWQGDFFYLTKNHSVFWEMGQGEIVLNVVTWLSVFLVLGLFFWLIKKGNKLTRWQRLGIGLVLVGGISNTFDRAGYKYVIDYFSFWISNFNLADVYIVSGVLLLISEQLFIRRKK